MPVKLSEAPILYHPSGPVEKLEADLEWFSDPEEFDQDDPMLVAQKEQIQRMISGDYSDPQTEPQDVESQTRGVLTSLLTDEAEVDEALSKGRYAKAKP